MSKKRGDKHWVPDSKSHLSWALLIEIILYEQMDKIKVDKISKSSLTLIFEDIAMCLCKNVSKKQHYIEEFLLKELAQFKILWKRW